jgi:polysaccharide deacetylase family protein (PEP-CTERM system associated)
MVPTHAFSVDVEDWPSGVLSMWFGKEVHPGAGVVPNTLRLLEILGAHGAKATWFFLGDVALSHPRLVRQVVEAGHEVGVHGLRHTPVWAQSPAVFRENIGRARDAIEQAGGARVLGHRAPTFSIGPSTAWAFEVLVECGFAYDSSAFPFRGRRYGDPTAPIVPWKVETPVGSLLEVPLSVVSILGRRVPVCGGGYMRHFPTGVTLAALRQLTREGRPAVFFVHPYELDDLYEAETFRLPLPAAKAAQFWLWRRLQYRNRRGMEKKLGRILREVRFRSIEGVFGVNAGSGARWLPGSANA